MIHTLISESTDEYVRRRRGGGGGGGGGRTGSER
jgi:hypothetical protein